MKVTAKGQVTIPLKIREKMGITPDVEIDFVEEKNRVYLVKLPNEHQTSHKFKQLRGIADVKITTDEVMALTRGDE